ncbi:MAG: N-acetylglucosamine kinase [Bacteroidota bacterium]
MILICDSGSTKADWALLSGNKIISEFQTEGLNPVHLPGEKLMDILSGEKNITSNSDEITEVHFFGSGCGNDEGKTRMTDALKKFFPTSIITVENDLFAAAFATARNQKGIISILGTGSNCCFYDGSAVHIKNFGLGYILGDEASGAWFGKKLLWAFLYGRLPGNLNMAFIEEHKLNRELIIEAVYRKPNPNIFLSSMVPFMSKHKADPYMNEFLSSGIDVFFETNIKGFQEAENVPLHFVGSVAATLDQEIRATGKKKNLSIGKILKRPMDGLKEYFLSR